jgi:hypothetical protein
MNIRTVTQIEVNVLYLNPVAANSESKVPMAAASDEDILRDWYKLQVRDDAGALENEYYRAHKEDSILYNFNEWDESDFFGPSVTCGWMDMSDFEQAPDDLRDDILWLG